MVVSSQSTTVIIKSNAPMRNQFSVPITPVLFLRQNVWNRPLSVLISKLFALTDLAVTSGLSVFLSMDAQWLPHTDAQMAHVNLPLDLLLLKKDANHSSNVLNILHSFVLMVLVLVMQLYAVCSHLVTNHLSSVAQIKLVLRKWLVISLRIVIILTCVLLSHQFFVEMASVSNLSKNVLSLRKSLVPVTSHSCALPEYVENPQLTVCQKHSQQLEVLIWSSPTTTLISRFQATISNLLMELTSVAPCQCHSVALTVAAKPISSTASKFKDVMNQHIAINAQVVLVSQTRMTVNSNHHSSNLMPNVLRELLVVTMVSVDKLAQSTMVAQWILHSDALLVNVPTSSLSVLVFLHAIRTNHSDASPVNVSPSQKCVPEFSVLIFRTT